MKTCKLLLLVSMLACPIRSLHILVRFLFCEKKFMLLRYEYKWAGILGLLKIYLMKSTGSFH